MKTLQILFVLAGVCISNSSYAQSLGGLMGTEPERDTTATAGNINKDNLLDMQTNLFTQLLGEDLDGNATGNSIGFLELLEKIDLPAEEKQHYREMYIIQAKNFTERQKDSLARAFGRKIMEARRH